MLECRIHKKKIFYKTVLPGRLTPVSSALLDGPDDCFSDVPKRSAVVRQRLGRRLATRLATIAKALKKIKLTLKKVNTTLKKN